MNKTFKILVLLCVMIGLTRPIKASVISGRGSFIANDETGIADTALYDFLKAEAKQSELYSNDFIGYQELTITSYDYPVTSLVGLSKLSMPNLKIMNVAVNQLESIDELLSFPTIEELSLYHMKASSLPANINLLQNLKLFRIEGGNLASLPSSFYDIITLKSLTLKNLPMTKISQDIAKLMYLTELILDGVNLQEVPLGIYQLSQLESLGLMGLQMSVISEKIELLEKLKTLRLDNNKFTKIPNKIFELEQLQYLSFRQNKLTTVDRLIQSLLRLSDFDVSNNELTTLPLEIVNLPDLKYLNLSENNWNCLPAEFKYLSLVDTKNIFETYQIKACGSVATTPGDAVDHPMLAVREGLRDTNGFSNSDVIIDSDQMVNFIINGVANAARDMAISFSLEGKYVVSAINQQGNLSNTITFTIDKTKPKIKVLGKENDLGIYTIDVAVDADEDGYFIVNGIKEATSSRLLMLSDEQHYTISFVDFAGNSSDVLDFVLQRDNTINPSKKKSDTLLLFLMFLLVSGLLGGGTYFFLKKGTKEDETST